MANSELIAEVIRQIKQPLWDNWYIQEKIGSGAYSAVYRVTAKRMSRTDVSAMKIEPLVPPDDIYPDEERRRRAVEERRQLAINESNIMFSLRNCPNIVAYQDEMVREFSIDGKFAGYYFLIRMEYLTGVSDLLKTRKFDLSEKNVRKLAADIGAGLKAAHDQNIIHRDVKPGNFFVSQDGTYKLGDFNISKRTSESGTFAGTNGYLAPEVYFARSSQYARYNSQADIYSFGISLYQMMNDMYMPFEKEMQLSDAIDKRMNGAPLPPPSNASPGFAKVILKACAYNTVNRYKSMDQFLKDLSGAGNSPVSSETTRSQATVLLEQDRPLPPVNPFAALAAQSGDRSETKSSGNKPRKRTVEKAESSINPVPIFAVLLLILAAAAVGLTIFLLSRSSSSDNDSSTGPMPITELDANLDSLSIGLYEDIEITDVTFPDTISRHGAENDVQLQTGYSMNSTLYALNDQLVITVNDDADEELQWDTPEDLKVSAKKDGDSYRITFNAERYLGRDAVCKVVFYGSEKGVYKEIQVNVTNDGPFQDQVVMRSADPDIISIYEENGGENYKIHSTGTATINWIYNGEIKFTKKIKVTD